MLDMNQRTKEALDLFQKKNVKKGQVVFTDSEQREFNLVNNEFTLFRTVFNQDMNVMTYQNQKKGSYYINKISEQDLETAMDMALLSAESGEEDESYDIAPDQGFLEVKKGILEPNINELFLKTEELLEDIKKRFPQILIQELIVSHVKQHKIFVNTNHTICDEQMGYYSVDIGFSGHEGEETTSLFYTGFMLDHLEGRLMEQADLSLQLQTAQNQLGAKPLEGKFMGTVIFTPSCLNSFLSYIYGLTADKNILDRSCIWIDKIGEKIADQRLSIRIDPEDPRIVCGENITSEGYKSEKFDFILRGILKNFGINAYVARKSGYQRAGCDSFNFIMESGDTKYDEMVKHITKGIVIGGFSGGRPSSNGDFSGVAKNSVLIEDGKVIGSITEAMISGNLAEMLNHIRDISVETIEDGMSVLPFVSFDEILVLGK